MLRKLLQSLMELVEWEEAEVQEVVVVEEGEEVGTHG
jgi:hypothetical protein